MSILRVEHSKERPFIIVTRNVLDGSDLSWAAKGLWTYLMGRPDNWNISVAHLCKIYSKKGGGEKAIYSILTELIEEGYCIREQGNGSKGKFQKLEYVVYEFKNKVPHRPQGDAVERRAVKRATNKERVLPINEFKQQQRVAKAPVVVSSEKPKKQEQDFSENDEGAKIYMKKLDDLGESYEEKAIIQAFRNNGWTKNKSPAKDELLKQFKNGSLYQGNGGEFECIKDDLGIGFLPVDYPSAQPYSALFKSKTFKKDFEKLLVKLQIKQP